MKAIKRTYEQASVSTLQKTLFEIAFDYGISFVNTQYRDAESFECELRTFVNNDEQIMSLVVKVNVNDYFEHYKINQHVYDCKTEKRTHTYNKEVGDKYSVIETVCNWIRTL